MRDWEYRAQDILCIVLRDHSEKLFLLQWPAIGFTYVMNIAMESRSVSLYLRLAIDCTDGGIVPTELS
jgi:hypothetical protein